MAEDRHRRGTSSSQDPPEPKGPLDGPSGDLNWPTEGSRAEALAFGFAIPFDALVLVWKDPLLRRRALVPTLSFLGLWVAAAYTVMEPPDHRWQWLIRIYGSIVAAAAISPIVFTKSYARFAALARARAGFSPRRPFVRGYVEATWESLVQGAALAFYLVPFSFVLDRVPVVGHAALALLAAAWAIHWSVIEALDAARVLPAEDQPPTPLAVSESKPWFARVGQGEGTAAWLAWCLGPVRAWGSVVAPSLKRWRPELAFVRRFPWMTTGFALAGAILLAIPVLNLAFRPILVAAAALWLARAEVHEKAPGVQVGT